MVEEYDKRKVLKYMIKDFLRFVLIILTIVIGLMIGNFLFEVVPGRYWLYATFIICVALIIVIIVSALHERAVGKFMRSDEYQERVFKQVQKELFYLEDKVVKDAIKHGVEYYIRDFYSPISKRIFLRLDKNEWTIDFEKVIDCIERDWRSNVKPLYREEMLDQLKQWGSSDTLSGS